MNNSAQWKRIGSLLYVTIFVVILLVDAVVNSESYRSRLGSELLKIAAVGFGIVFWIWMLSDLMMRITRSEEIKRPWLWGVLVVLTYVVGAFVYYVVIFYPSFSSSKPRLEGNVQD